MNQLGFGFDQMHEEEKSAHLPSEMEQAIPVYRAMIARHHAAMLEGDYTTAMDVRKEARRLAVKLNGGDPGILGSDDAPGYVLARETAAPEGTVPMWGQEGMFVMTVKSVPMLVEIDGMFGVCSNLGPDLGFTIKAVYPDKPFPSETGFRSFHGSGELHRGMTVQEFCKASVEAYMHRECKGRMKEIEHRYRGR